MRLIPFLDSFTFQNDLLQLVLPFGVVTKLVILRAKNQVSVSLPLDFFFWLWLLINLAEFALPAQTLIESFVKMVWYIFRFVVKICWHVLNE